MFGSTNIAAYGIGTRIGNILSWTAAARKWAGFIAYLVALLSLWKAFGKDHIYQNINGKRYKLPAFHWFMHYNVKRVSLGFLTMDRPPIMPNLMPDYITGEGYIETIFEWNQNMYRHQQLYNDKPYYFRQMDPDFQYPIFIFWYSDRWYISDHLATPPTSPYWYKTTELEEIPGIYTPDDLSKKYIRCTP